MLMIAVDDEKLALDNLCKQLVAVEPNGKVVGFLHPDEAFEYIAENKVDIAFLDVEIGEYSGIALAKKCKDLCPQINIIFVTGHSKYLMDAFQLHASGYLLKPVRANDLRKEIDNLRHPPQMRTSHRVRMQTFGSFEVFVDGVPLEFGRKKSRECLAYLVDRKGARVTTEQLTAILWEDVLYDRKAQNNMHTVLNELMRALKKVQAEDIILKIGGDIAIATDKIDCDYYRFLNGDTAAINSFCGEYMSNYSWAEFTLGELCSKIGNI